MSDFDASFDTEFDPAKLADDAVQANLDPSIFDRISDGDVRKPHNIVEWIRGRTFLNVTPFPKQIEICTNFLAQFCPDCTDPKLLRQDEQHNNMLLTIEVDYPLTEVYDRVELLVDGVCLKCKKDQNYFVNKGKLTRYLNLNGCAGMRSSKTVIVGGLLTTYQLVRYLALKSPSKFFGVLENQTLHSTFVAITAGQAKDTLWQAFKDRIDASPWFKEYHAHLDDEAKRLGKDRFYDYKETFLSYDHKQLVCSYCGPDIRTIRGRTRFNSGMDEKGWFDVSAETSSANAKVRMNAHETHTALVKSLRTIRSHSMRLRESGISDPPDALNCDVSSPSSLNDAIMVGLREANEDPTIYAFHYSTWEMNPDIPLSSLRDEMNKPREFERDYAATPPLGANQFIDNQPAVEKACAVARLPSITWSKKYHTDDFGQKTVYLEVKVVQRDKTRPKILTVDTGLSNNSFAITLWSFDRDDRKPVCDVAIECAPEEIKGERILVNFPMMFDHAMVPLVKGNRIIMAAFDRWNSIEAVQRLRRDHKIEAMQYALKWADFQAIRSRIMDSNLVLPPMEIPFEKVRASDRRFEDIVRSVPGTHLALQILTVREGGRKVLKPINGTDDLFRCLCLAVRFIMDPDYTRKFEHYGTRAGAVVTTVGVVRGHYKDQATVRAAVSSTYHGPETIGIRKGFVPTLK